jgi:hypothetical protein
MTLGLPKGSGRAGIATSERLRCAWWRCERGVALSPRLGLEQRGATGPDPNWCWFQVHRSWHRDQPWGGNHGHVE